ncbi:hypothetical protein F5877DRAFT_86600 [Lentinula edodes]|nr:hypothetical protein F5877DRAFT_86600 [Lentinula edodes]
MYDNSFSSARIWDVLGLSGSSALYLFNAPLTVPWSSFVPEWCPPHSSGSASGPLSNALSGAQVNSCILSYAPVTVPFTPKPVL